MGAGAVRAMPKFVRKERHPCPVLAWLLVVLHCGDRSHAAGHDSLPLLLLRPRTPRFCAAIYSDEPSFPWQSRLRNEMKRLEGDRAGVRSLLLTKRRFYGGDGPYFLELSQIYTCSENSTIFSPSF